jgi:alkylation response protein AidB-like acyl-CoA dehydrogenase
VADDVLEPVEHFRQRVRSWLKENVPPSDARAGSMRGDLSDEEELADVARQRALQKMLFDAGLAGIVVPTEYGGAGLTDAHQAVLNDEIVGYQFPDRLQVPGHQPCMALILEFGTEEQKKAHVPRILDGSEIWMQMLSEPSGGSDVAGAQTTAVRDGEEWVLNGSKIWTTGAWWSDWALCLARTNWDVQKHRGLSVFMLKIHQPGIEVHRIEMLNGAKEFCQEFITDVTIPDSDRIGDVDDGWTVGTRWMYFEKTLSTSRYTIRPGGVRSGRGPVNLLPLARAAGRAADPLARDMVGEAHTLGIVQREALDRVTRGMQSGYLNNQAGALTRLAVGANGLRQAQLAFDIAGTQAVAWSDAEESLGAHGMAYLTKQAGVMGGGTIEMARNVVSERVLGMPRERTMDKDVAFRDVPKGPTHG